MTVQEHLIQTQKNNFVSPQGQPRKSTALFPFLQAERRDSHGETEGERNWPSRFKVEDVYKRQVYQQAGCSKPILRLLISSMEDAAIRDGFEHLRPGTDYDLLYPVSYTHLDVYKRQGLP